MTSACRHPAVMPPPEGDSPFWQLLALLAKEPDLGWLDWALRQRGAGTSREMAEDAAEPAEGATLRSRSEPPLGATFPPPQEDEAPPSGGAPPGQRSAAVADCPHCRSQANCHFGPRPLEALRSLEHSAHPRIWKMYGAALSRFVTFREESGGHSTWPIPRDQISGFLLASDLQNRSSPKILGDLAALSYLSRLFHFPDLLLDFVASRMAVAFNRRGDIQRRGWTPFSKGLVRCLVRVVNTVCTGFYDCILFRAAFILAFCAALRPQEMVAEDGASVDPALLCRSDFVLSEDSIDIEVRALGVGPERLVLHLVRSREPCMCPVLALSNYLQARPRREGPLFICSNGEPLTKAQFLAVLHAALRHLGLLPQQFGLHSFWLGAVITAVKRGFPEELILRLARWPDRGNPQ
ncbi:uncharacterized protein LOC125439599 [Sphaerodactylus townsendi]|uniref:uncharacterized protein LOC125439599 n=1 Tax=Sphaerodactylus townsendi TaxID=933632 RepID=UPI002026D247|nr:uncharacterized protein LOC125439599 [Sphaerodactylus townsendi]